MTGEELTEALEAVRDGELIRVRVAPTGEVGLLTNREARGGPEDERWPRYCVELPGRRDGWYECDQMEVSVMLGDRRGWQMWTRSGHGTTSFRRHHDHREGALFAISASPASGWTTLRREAHDQSSQQEMTFGEVIALVQACWPGLEPDIWDAQDLMEAHCRASAERWVARRLRYDRERRAVKTERPTRG